MIFNLNIVIMFLHTAELALALVPSTRARAKILSVDFSNALKAPGVVDFVDHTDVPGKNLYGLLFPESQLFAHPEVILFCWVFFMLVNIIFEFLYQLIFFLQHFK